MALDPEVITEILFLLTQIDERLLGPQEDDAFLLEAEAKSQAANLALIQLLKEELI